MQEARGLWGRQKGILFDVGVFHLSYHETQAASHYQQHQLDKKLNIRVMLTVNPSLCSFLSTAGGVGKEATIYYNYLADLLQYFNYILSWMLSALSFSLLCSAVLVICGKRKLQSSELPVSPLSEKLYSY